MYLLLSSHILYMYILHVHKSYNTYDCVCHHTDMTTHTRVDTCTYILYKGKQQHRKLPKGVCTSTYITGITDEGMYIYS